MKPEGGQPPAAAQVSADDPVAALAPWFHNLHLPDGRQTFPDHFLGDFPKFKWEELAPRIPDDLTGWSALDIGCNAGFYTFELARRGATVLGIDSDPHYLRQAEWAASQYPFAERIRFRQMQVYELPALAESFDLVLFMGVFYHLRYPLLALDLVAQKVKRLLVFQTLTMPPDQIYDGYVWDSLINERDMLKEPGWPKMAFIEHKFAGDPTNWWIANRAGVEAMLRSSGMRILGEPYDETWLCEPDPEHPSAVATWDAAELVAATGCRRVGG